LLHVLDSAIEQRRLKSENAYLRSQLEERYRFEGIVGKSRPMERLFQLLETVAPTNSTILITGETGTGKEVVARAIHHNSPRRANRFVALNCSAIPETLLEAELFGHVRGAFTGAVGNRQGRLEQAHKGTLFLDEVGTMPTALQMKMLRVLQEREFERIGETRTIKVDVRIVAATNADLAKMVKEGTFREDLYYRLNVVQVHLAALRERAEDIPLLVSRFIQKHRDSGKVTRSGDDPGANITVSQEAMRRLMSFAWPGNVRQLENAIERALAMIGARKQIEITDLPSDLQAPIEPTAKPSLDLPQEGMNLPELIAQIEKDLIDRALARTEQNKGAAARLLGLKRTTLVEKLKRL
jgi:transcriptional regulator with PAS, ATPase and Fis domain